MFKISFPSTLKTILYLACSMTMLMYAQSASAVKFVGDDEENPSIDSYYKYENLEGN